MVWQKIRSYWVLFFLAFTVRLYFVNKAFFLYDESKFFAVIRDLVEGLYFPRLGPPITIPGAYIPGPFFFFFSSLSQLFGASVYGSYIFIALCGALSIVFVFDFVKTKWGEDVAWITSVFLCVTPWMIFYNLTLWNPNIIYLFLALSLSLCARLEVSWSRWQAVLLLVVLGLFPQIHLSAIAFWIGFFIIFWPVFKKITYHEKKQTALWSLFFLFLLYLPYFTIEIKMKFANTAKILFGVSGAASEVQSNGFSFFLYLIRFISSDLSYFFMHGFHKPLTEWEMLSYFFNSEKSLLSQIHFFISSILASLIFVFSLYKGIRLKEKWQYAFLFFILVHFILLIISKKQVFPHYFNGLIIVCAVYVGLTYKYLQQIILKKIYLIVLVFSLVFGFKSGLTVADQVFFSQSLGVKSLIIEKTIESIKMLYGKEAMSGGQEIKVGIWRSTQEKGYFLQPHDESLTILAQRVFGQNIHFERSDNHELNLVYISTYAMERDLDFLSQFNILESFIAYSNVNVFLVKKK